MDFSKMPKDGRIYGTVIDSMNNVPLEYATISMKHLKDSTQLSGGIADDKGKFDISGLMYGPWEVTISFMGYEDKVIDRVRVMPQNNIVDLGRIMVIQSAEQIDEVEIINEKPIIEMNVDKKVFNVDKNITTTGGGAEEVLNNVPGVEVDMDGQITLRGNSNVTVLIDGKPSTLTGGSRQAILDQIPADAIESIEIITNPSAKYDPDGMSGIINIVLKKNKLQGVNGSVSTNYGIPTRTDEIDTRGMYSGNASINYRNNKWNLYSNYSYRQNNMWREGTNYRELMNTDSANILSQESLGDRLRESHTIKAGADYSFTPKSTLIMSGTFNTKNRGGSGTEDFLTYSDNVFIDYYDRTNNETDQGYSYDATLGYEQVFKTPKQKLTTYFNYSYGIGEEVESVSQNYYNLDGSVNDAFNPYFQDQTNDDYNVNILHSLDYVHPTKTGKIEMGMKYTGRIIDQNYKFFYDSTGTQTMLENDFLSNHFNYDEKIMAAYGIYSSKFKKFEYQFGLRAEQALTTSLLTETNESFNNDYFSLYPSGHITYKPGKGNEFAVSYSRRVNRPGFWSLNPFVDYSDPNNIRTGNPFLRPEYINSYELIYTKYIGRNSITASVYHKQTYDMIQRIVTVDSAGVSTLSWTNYAGAENTGVEVIFMASPTKWLRMNGSFNIYQNKVDGSNLDQDFSNTAFNNFGRLSMTIKPIDNLDIQLSGFYRGRMEFAIGHMDPMYSMDLAFKYYMLDRKLDASLRIGDVFNTRQFSIHTADTYFMRDIYRKRQSRLVQVGLSYRFGKMQMSKRRGGPRNNNGMDGGDGGVM